MSYSPSNSNGEQVMPTLELNLAMLYFRQMDNGGGYILLRNNGAPKHTTSNSGTWRTPDPESADQSARAERMTGCS